MLKKWETLESNVIYQNPWWTYRRDEFQIPEGVSGEYHYVQTHGSTMILPITADGKLLLVKQYRYLGKKESLEFPCGAIKPGSDANETAHIELREETGFRAGMLNKVGEFNPYNGVTDEICEVFVGADLAPAPAPSDETEEFELVECLTSEVDDLIRRNEIWDGMTMAAWLLARARVVQVISGASS